MAAFADPFSGKSPPDKLSKEELARAIRLDIAAEHEATNLYEAHADATNEPLAKKVLENIAHEEKVHAGEFNALLDVITGDEGKFQQQGEDEVVAAIDELTPEMRAAVADYSPPTDATIIYQDRNAGGGWYRVFSAILSGAPLPRNWNILSERDVKAYQSWIDRGHGGKTYATAVAWRKVALDPWKEIERREAEYEERQRIEQEGAAREKRIADALASPEYGLTDDEIKQLKVGQTIEVAWYEEPQIITEIHDDEVYVRGISEPEGETSGFVGKDGIRRTALHDLRPSALDTSYHHRWDSANIGRHVDLVRKAGWITGKGQLSRSGERFAESKWDDLPLGAQNVLKRYMDDLYGSDLRPATAKEPWQMTWREYRKTLEDAAYEKRFEPSAPGSPPNEVSRLRLNIGDEGTFYRSGELPKSGRSRNAITGQLEEGISVYPTPYASSLAGLSERQWYMGKGRVVAIGSDGEPIITPLGKWNKVGKPGYEPAPFLHESAVKQALSEGKTVPPEVLAEYPDLAQARGAKALPVWVEEFESVGGHMDPDGTVLLYHATTQDKAASILAEGVLRRPLDAPDSYGVYFSSSPSVSEDYGDGTIIPVRVQASDLHPDDVFPGRRMDFTVPTRGGAYRPVAVGDAALAQVRGARADGSPIVVRFGASERKYNHTIAAFERAGLPFYDYMADMGHYPWRYGLMNDTEEARELLKEQGGSIARSGSAPSLPRLEVLAWQYPKLAEGASRAVRIRPAALPPTLGDIDMDEINAMVEDLHNEVSNMSAKLGAPDPITGGLKTWLASVGGLPGIVEDPNAAADTPCIAAELEEGESLIFSPGIIGALDEEQQQLYCQNGMERRELTEEQRARLSALQDAARTCGAETGGLDPNIQPFFSCLGRELRAKGEDVW